MKIMKIDNLLRFISTEKAIFIFILLSFCSIWIFTMAFVTPEKKTIRLTAEQKEAVLDALEFVKTEIVTEKIKTVSAARSALYSELPIGCREEIIKEFNDVSFKDLPERIDIVITFLIVYDQTKINHIKSEVYHVQCYV